MLIDDCLNTDQVFSHVAGDGTVRHFNAGELLRGAYARTLEFEAINMGIDAELVAMVRERHGVEPGHLARVDAGPDADPVLVVALGDGSHIIVDGNHRVVAAFDAGRDSVRALVFPPLAWHRCLVTDLPMNEAELVECGVVGAPS